MSDSTKASEPRGRTSAAARTAMWLGIVAAFTGVIGIGFLLGVAAVIVGERAIRRIDDPWNADTGESAARWGVLLGRVGMFTTVGIAATIAVVSVLSPFRRTARCEQRNTQVRGMHQGMITYSQGNNGYFPGLDSQGNPLPVGSGDAAWQLTPGDSVERRFAILLDGNYFTGEYIISPVETKDAWTTPGTQVTLDYYSFALLDISETGGRRDEWRETLNTDAVVISDRNTGLAAQPTSIHTNTPGDWRGLVAWNDNHTEYLTNYEMESTRYGQGAKNTDDHLFQSPATDDALMIHTGN